MKIAVWAIYYRSISSHEKPQHHHCPTSKDSWCKYNRATVEGQEDDFIHKQPLPEDVAKAIYPVFEVLADSSLLERCQLRATQNQNEPLHHLI